MPVAFAILVPFQAVRAKRHEHKLANMNLVLPITMQGPSMLTHDQLAYPIYILLAQTRTEYVCQKEML